MTHGINFRLKIHSNIPWNACSVLFSVIADKILYSTKQCVFFLSLLKQNRLDTQNLMMGVSEVNRKNESSNKHQSKF